MAGVQLGYLRYVLGLDTLSFEKGITKSQADLQRMQRSFSKTAGVIRAGLAGLASGLTVGLFVNVVKGALDYAGSLGEVSQQLGVTTTDLQTFRYAAGQVGVDQAELETGLSKLTITLGKVAAGAKAPTAALNAIGISAKQVAGLNTGDAFRLIADGLEKIPDRAERAAVEVALFGKSGAMLDTLLSGGSKALNALAAAAEELGIVLSADQIARADETADKLAAVKTVLSARIAGVVADNAQSIINLADSLAYLIVQAGEAAAKMARFYRTIAIEGARWAAAHPELSKIAFGRKGTETILRAGAGAIRSNIADRAPAKPANQTRPASAIGDFLAGSGGGGRKGKKDHSAEEAERARLEALRDANQFDQESRRLQADILQAQQNLSVNYEDRARIAEQLLDLERQGQDAQLAFEVAAGEKTQAQADQVRSLLAQKQSLDRQAIADELAADRKEDAARLIETGFDIQRRALESELQLASTASEERDIRLRLLDLQYREERAALERVLADEKSTAIAKQQAQARLSALNGAQANDRQGVINSTRGPWEQFIAGVPNDAAKMQEALEQVKVNGVDALTDGLVDAAMGVRSLGDVFKQVAAQILADLLRIQIQKMLVSALGSLGFGGSLPIGGARASGGPVLRGKAYLVGEKGPELFAPGRSGRIIPNDNLRGMGGGGGGLNVNVSLPQGMRPHEGRPTGLAIGRGVQERMAYSIRGRR